MRKLGFVLGIICLLVIAWNADAATRPDAVGRRAMVTSAHSMATMAGIDILKKGGNAFDAAVAVAAALNVLEPNASGIGGNGFMTVYDAKTGQVHSLHMTGAAPYAASSEAYGGREAQDFGTLAGCVPGNFGGWIALLDRFGTMSLGQVLESATYYAEFGFPVDPNLAGHIANSKKKLELFPTSAKVYLPYGKLPMVGELLVQKDLASTFKRLAAAEQKARERRQEPQARRSWRPTTSSTRATSPASSWPSTRRTAGSSPPRTSPTTSPSGATRSTPTTRGSTSTPTAPPRGAASRRSWSSTSSRHTTCRRSATTAPTTSTCSPR